MSRYLFVVPPLVGHINPTLAVAEQLAGRGHEVAWTGLEMPLCCENIFAPALPRPAEVDGVDALARRAREFLELVIQGLHAPRA